MAVPHLPGTREGLMMIFWIVASLMTAFVVAAGLWPLAQGRRQHDATQQAVAFYEENRAELLRQRDAGEITADEFLAADAEQARNLIARTKALKSQGGGDAAVATARRKMAALAVLFAVPALSLLIYLRLGSPQLPDLPLAARDVAKQGGDLASALRKIEAHLHLNPNDGKGYEVVAPVYMRTGRYAEAVHAFGRIVDLLGPTPDRWADLGEAHLAAGGGAFSPEARSAFEKAVAIDPAFAKARFYLAMAKEQDGNAAGALADLRAIEAGLPEGPAKARVQAEITRFTGQPPAPAAPNVEASEAGRAIASMPKADQEAAIRSMVEGLEARLTTQGGSADEWIRLIRARAVMGDAAKASTLLAEALKRLGENAETRNALEMLGRSLNLPASP